MSAASRHVPGDPFLELLRDRPGEWRRRGMTPPSELDAIVERRLAGVVRGVPTDPTYADFFVTA
ncbi:hypothetical protein [Curtobacterium aurantiacum]|uniref:hypothetical protein n=1 Tax=Curtobacterium aurantiacum TaxID=3236919 RepID=UPI001BDF01DB|nr:hypothetical protein [Curtobacterium flaccumfaciens]MBT1680366.1 hypothetical protein [Curtobacterium flaccumfaciens pv. flaccumfaciens]